MQQAVLVGLVLLGCSGSSATTTPMPAPPPPVTWTPVGTRAEPIDVATLGSACSAEGTCATGALCVYYYGIAGPRGPEFSSCEIECSGPARTCPSGTTCIGVADGPGRVCRPVDR